MRKALGPIVALTLTGLGCAVSVQETRMYQGPFGRTEIGGFVVAADPAASKMLVQTYDGDLWVYDVSPRVTGRLGTLRVGDEVSHAFDDRVSGVSVLAIDVLPAGRNPLPGGVATVAGLLPFGVVVGAPAIAPSRGVVMVGTDIGSTGVVTASGVVTDVGAPRVFGDGSVVGATGGVIVPGFGSFSTFATGPLGPQATQSLGLVPSVALAPVTTPGASVAGGFPPGRTPQTQGNFTPGTISPGVTTANPAAPGQPVPMGSFTPGTIAPGVSPGQGTAPPTRPTNAGAPGSDPVRSFRPVPLSQASRPTPENGSVPAQGQGLTLPGQAAPNQGQPAPGQGQAAPNQGQAAPNQGQPAPAQGTAAPTQAPAAAQPAGTAPAAGRPAQPAGPAPGGARGATAPGTTGGTAGSSRQD